MWPGLECGCFRVVGNQWESRLQVGCCFLQLSLKRGISLRFGLFDRMAESWWMMMVGASQNATRFSPWWRRRWRGVDSSVCAFTQSTDENSCFLPGNIRWVFCMLYFWVARLKAESCKSSLRRHCCHDNIQKLQPQSKSRVKMQLMAKTPPNLPINKILMRWWRWIAASTLTNALGSARRPTESCKLGCCWWVFINTLDRT